MSLSRREMLLATSAASVAAAIPFASHGFAQDVPRTPVVDTHVHCFAGRNNAEFPYHPRGPYAPESASPPELLLERMKSADVDYAIIVHPEPYQDDHRYFEHCMTVGGGRLKGTCLFFADREDEL